MSKKEAGLRQLLKAIKEGSRESFLVPIQSHQKLSLLSFCQRKETLHKSRSADICFPTWPDSRIS